MIVRHAFGKKPIDTANVKNVLVRVTNWVGDLVMCLPALEALRQNFPDSTISVLAKPWVAPIFDRHPAIDNIIVYDKKGGKAQRFLEMMRIIRIIRQRQFDLAVLFQNAFEAAFIAYLGGVKNRVGYNTDGRRFLLTHCVIRDVNVLKEHQVDYYLSLIRAMGWRAEGRNPSIHITETSQNGAKRYLENEGVGADDRVVGLGPGAIFGGAKRWPSESFAVIGDWAIEKWGAKVLLFGSPKETEICTRLCTSMHNSPLNLCGKTTLIEAIAIIHRCKMFITNDSGLMHIAAALGVPTLAVFGSTDPMATGPRGPKTWMIKKEFPCAPCLKPECITDHQCMRSIRPEEVWEKMERMYREEK